MSGRAATQTVIPGRCALSVGNPKTTLAPGWSWLPLSEAADVGTGHTPSRGVAAYWDGPFQWIGIRDARAHHGRQIWNTNQTITQAGLDNSSARLLPAGTVALSRTASVGYVVQLGREMATSQDFFTWTCSAALEPHFLMYALQAEGEDIRAFGEGSTHTTIYFPELKALHLKAPPPPEQRRIVAKIDRLSACSKRARDELVSISPLVKRYKRSILDAAFCGRLTCEWRVSNRYDEEWSASAWSEAGETINGKSFPSTDYASEGIKLIRPGNLHESGQTNWTNANTRYLPLSYASAARTHFFRGEEILVNLTAQSLDDGISRARLFVTI